MKRNLLISIIFAAMLAILLGAILWPSPKGSPDAIIKMAKEGESEDKMLDAVSARTSPYGLKADDVVRLHDAKVPDKVIISMLEKNSGK
jgi:hypothetical protein